MVRSALKRALQAEKGVNVQKIKDKKKFKQRVRRREQQEVRHGGAAVPAQDGDEWEDEDDEDANDVAHHDVAEGNEELDEGSEGDEQDEGEEELGGGVDFEALNDSDTSESSIELEEKIVRQPKTKQSQKDKKATVASPPPSADNDEEDDDEDDDEDEEQDPVSLSDLEDLPEEDKDDLIPFQRLRINNTSALLASLARIAIPTDSSVPFATHQSVTSTNVTAEAVPDVSDDVSRELALYSQCLEAVTVGRKKLLAEKVPFSRPTDYFAEMVKSDEHVEKIRAKLVAEATNKKAAAEARKQRDLKKFGKQVQIAKLQERQKAKKETLEKIKTLKRKRQESSGDLGGDRETNDLFDVAVDNEIKKHKQGQGQDRGRGERAGGPGPKRQKKNDKYGSGGKKRFAKSGDAVSSGDLSGFRSDRKGKPAGVKAQRPGKTRRKASAMRR